MDGTPAADRPSSPSRSARSRCSPSASSRARNGAAVVMCGLCFAGLLAARLAGFSNRALVPLAPAWSCSSGWSGSIRRRSASPRPAPSPTAAGGLLVGWAVWPSTCAAGSRGRCGRSAPSRAVFGAHVLWELGELLGDRILDTALIPSRARLGARHRLRHPRRRRRRPGSPSAVAARGRATRIAWLGDGLTRRSRDRDRRRRRRPRARGRIAARRGRRRRSRSPTATRSASTRVVAELGLDEERVDARVVDLLDEQAPRRLGDGARASASAASTASCTWSAAGRAASRSRPRRSPTTSGCTTCSCAP